uniref:Uncharacterized protein n=1 Tax=Brassica oleracea var. oleracea TaxID=109376 RepID=A0A0D3CZ68_BRAOL
MIKSETSNFVEFYFPAEVQIKNRRPARHDDRGERATYHVTVPDIFTDVGRLSGKPKDRRLTEQERSHLQTYLLTNCEYVLQYERIFMAEKGFEYRYTTEEELEELKQREFFGCMLTYADQVCYIKYPRVRNRDDPWVTVTSLNPRGRVQGSSELEDPLQPSTSGNLSAAEDLAAVGLVVDLTDFGEEAVVHLEDEQEIGEFHQDPDSDSSGDDDSETE